MRYFFLACIMFLAGYASSQKVVGAVTDAVGQPLAFSTIEVKGENMTATANAEGKFMLQLSPGTYTISCRHVGYLQQEKEITVPNANVQLNFILKFQDLTLTEVFVKKGEDPAYQIIRSAIKRRPLLRDELKSFTVDVYTKGLFKLRDHPKKFMGEKVDFEDGDTGKLKTLFLSETISRYSVQPPKNTKVEVLASKVSGQSDGFGLSAPQIISFYENNIQMGQNLAPRGFISPIADNALNYYTYKYEGAFFEEGRQISRIRLTPKRKFEPAFSGYINIVEDEWRIHSLQLDLYKNNGMEILDTLQVQQLYAPQGDGRWVVRSQVIYPAAKVFGFDAHGSFVNVYSNYNLSPVFPYRFFDKVILSYSDSSQKNGEEYWSGARPIVLQEEEAMDYRKKDSLERLRKLPAYLDSIDRIRNKITLSKLVTTGISFENEKARSTLSIAPLTEVLSYNTVEGTVVNAQLTYIKKLDSNNTGRSISISPEVRYGLSNQHLNANATATYRFGKKYVDQVSLSGGSDVFQFNNAGPVGTLGSTIGTLFSGSNNLKIYEAVYGSASFSKDVGRGIKLSFNIHYQDRSPLENTTDFTFQKKVAEFTPNTAVPQFVTNISHHQAFITSIGLSWQPGEQFIVFPQRTISIGSKAPTFNLTYTQAMNGVLGSDVAYSKWLMHVTDAVNLKLFGAFNYRFDVGGFLNKARVEIPDHTHFKGNTSSLVAGSFMDRFQLVPHYYFSNTSSFYTLFLAEHHFNGFITNKIPGLKNLKWNLVGGANTLYFQPSKFYVEPFVGLENILKVFRVDYVWGFEKGQPARSGLRIGIKSSFLNNR